MFFLTKGECIVSVKDENKDMKKVAKIMAGALFGEVGLLASCTRTATVKPLIYSIIARLNKRNFSEMCS